MPTSHKEEGDARVNPENRVTRRRQTSRAAESPVSQHGSAPTQLLAGDAARSA